MTEYFKILRSGEHISVGKFVWDETRDGPLPLKYIGAYATHDEAKIAARRELGKKLLDAEAVVKKIKRQMDELQHT